MPNRVTLSANGPAQQFYDSLEESERTSLDQILDYIRDVPFEHGGLIRREFRPPVMVYFYNDGTWRITYGLSRIPATIDLKIDIWAIARARDT